ncbi:hypothetical protein SFRURICE_020611 [Spodoptera frugiperda]|nr:hypothetical protein SFRURICE_020611 [Spodoptera frugiperda]
MSEGNFLGVYCANISLLTLFSDTVAGYTYDILFTYVLTLVSITTSSQSGPGPGDVSAPGPAAGQDGPRASVARAVSPLARHLTSLSQLPPAAAPLPPAVYRLLASTDPPPGCLRDPEPHTHL